MKNKAYKVVVPAGASTGMSAAACEKVCRYLLKRYCEGCEKCESYGICKSINGGTGRKGLFDTCAEAGVYKQGG